MNVVITGTGLYTPPEVISNDELVQSYNRYVAGYNQSCPATAELLAESSVEFIEKASGIKSRHVVSKEGVLDPQVMHPLMADRPDDQPSIQCEMSLIAAREALAQANIDANEVDVVIVACSNPQRAYPAIAIEVQNYLDVQGFAYDMNVACSSATFALQAGAAHIKAGDAETVLIVNPEICSGHLEWKDRDCHFIFGDACTATVVQSSKVAKVTEAFEILSCKLATRFSNNIRNNFGFLNRCDPATQNARDKTFRQNGRKVFKEVVPMVVSLMSEQLAENHIERDQVKRLWLHQANLNMNQLICKKLMERDVSEEEAPVILDEYANTSSAGSVIAFHYYKKGLQAGDIGLLCSFGAGYSVGSILLQKVSIK